MNFVSEVMRRTLGQQTQDTTDTVSGQAVASGTEICCCI